MKTLCHKISDRNCKRYTCENEICKTKTKRPKGQVTNITLPQCVRDAQEVIHKFRLKQQCRHAKIKSQQFSSMQNVQDVPRKKGNSRIYGAANVAGLTVTIIWMFFKKFLKSFGRLLRILGSQFS